MSYSDKNLSKPTLCYRDSFLLSELHIASALTNN